MAIWNSIGNFFKKAGKGIEHGWNRSKATIGDVIATTSDIIKKVPGMVVDLLPNEGKLGQIKKSLQVAVAVADKAPGIFDKIAHTNSKSQI